MRQFSANLSLLFTEVEFVNRFKVAKAYGFNAVEIQFPYALPAKQIQLRLEDQQLKLVLFNVAADDLMQGGEGLACVPKKQDLFKYAVEQAVDYAERCQPHVINVLPGRCFDGRKTEKYLETFKENLCFALDAFSSLGIKTVFEAINTYDMPDFLVHSGAQMLEILQQLNHPDLWLQYDIYHAQRMGENFTDFINQHADKIAHIQFADSPGRGQPGTGNIDFKALFSCIEQSTYRGWLGAEYKPQGNTANSLTWLSM
jgi:hydroxypyruvate isomerase